MVSAKSSYKNSVLTALFDKRICNRINGKYTSCALDITKHALNCSTYVEDENILDFSGKQKIIS
jgi:hypothetical protein